MGCCKSFESTDKHDVSMSTPLKIPEGISPYPKYVEQVRYITEKSLTESQISIAKLPDCSNEVSIASWKKSASKHTLII